MSLRNMPLAVILAASALAAGAQAAERGRPETCAAALKEAQDAKAMADVKLAEEYERSDAQVYLMRLELSVTKQKLAAALAKCGVACAPSKP